MRTIKDPKKKPEVRRRADYEEEEEDSRSNKSTPPKKRKTAKSSKDDSSSLNDSGSFGDNQSDILSEKSSAYGEDDASDVSSLKSTPPKKRNKVLSKSQEINGDIHSKADDQEHSGKARGSKRNEKLEGTDSKISNLNTPKRNNAKAVDVEKKGQKGKKKCAKELGTEKSTKVQVKDSTQESKKSPKRKTAEPDKVIDNKKKSPQQNITSNKKSVTRKRKLSEDEEEEEEMEIPLKQSKNTVNKAETTKAKKKPKLTTEKEKTGSPKESAKSTEIQSKVLKKSKKQLKEEATQELKRQTEEQRNAHSVVNKDIESVNIKKKTSPKKKDSDNHITESAAEKGSNKFSVDKSLNTVLTNETDENVGSLHKKNTAVTTASTDTVDVLVKTTENKTDTENRDCPVVDRDRMVNKDSLLANTDHDGEEDESSSDLDTSFESINSVHDNTDKVETHPLSHQSTSTSTAELLEHKSEEKLESNVCIKCDRCGYVSRSKGGHTRHLRKCQPEQLGLDGESKGPKVHVCEKCEYSAPRRVLVINHMKSHGIYQCKRCQFRTDNEETLDEHSGQEHKDRSDCKFCKLCNRYVKCDQYPLEKHMEECKGRIPFKCPECSKEFQYESSLKCHVVSHYPDQPKLFSCSQCDYKSNYKANLKKHVRHIHEQRGDKTIKCPDCEKLFYTEDNMKRHQKLHSEERPHKCEKEGCEKAFKTLNGLKFHLVSHQTDRPFLCDVEGCNKDFKSKKSLAMHLNETHQNAPKNFHCSVEGCDMAFYKKCHFERHMAAHTDNRTYFCRWITCTKAFRTAESLKTHSLVHTDEKPVKCEHCDYTCRQRNSIRFHMKKKHPELLPNDLNSSSKSVKQSSQDSQQTMTDSKLQDKDKSEKDLASSSDNKENLIGSVKSEPNSPDSEHSKTDNHVKDSSPNKTEIKPKSTGNHQTVNSIKSPVSSSENKQNVPSKGNKEFTPVLNSLSSLNKKTSAKSLKSEANEKSSKESTANENQASTANENPVKKAKKTDMYEFMSEEESEDEMRPGLLRKEFDKDKPPLPPVTGTIDQNLLLSDLQLTNLESTKKPTDNKQQKVKKKPGPKPKPKPESEPDVKVPKKRGRKKKSETEKKVENKESETKSESKESASTEKVEKTKPKRGRSPKAKEMISRKNEKDYDDDDDDDDDENDKDKTPIKKKRGPKKKVKAKSVEEPEKVPKKRGRKKKVNTESKKEIEPENGDATINYSEVESDKMFADSKDGVSDHAETSLSNIPENAGFHDNSDIEEPKKHLDESDSKIGSNDLITTEELKDKSEGNENEQVTSNEHIDSNEHVDSNEIKDSLTDDEEKRLSDANSESSDIGSDFDEDLKPPPAPRPPPIYDSEDGDIESGPENEDCNGSMRSNERIRDFESSREISREISRDFESSREIDDSVKMSDINSVDTNTPKDTIGTPSSVNPYKNDSVGNDLDNQETPHPHSHHSSVPHTPSHSSIPPTPITNQEFESQNRIEETVIKNSSVQGQTNDENTDESSMPEVDKDYVGRFFEEIQSTQQPEQISRMTGIENPKSQEKVIESQQTDNGVPSSLPTNQTEASIEMQSPPTDVSHKRLDILPGEHPHDESFQSRSEHRISDRIPNVPTFDPQFNPIDPYASSALPPRDTILRQTDQRKIPSPLNASSSSSTSFMRFPESDAMLQRQRMTTPYDRNIQNLHRITDTALPSHNSASPLLRHVPGREDVFPGAAGVTGSMSRNPFHSSWTGQEVRPPHWGHPTYLQRQLDQQTGSSSSALFGKDSYLPGREFMFDPSRAAAERNMFSSLASSHSQRPDIPHDTFPLERFDLGSYLSSHAYNAAPSLPVDYTRSAHSSTQKSFDERYRQSSSGVTDFRTLPQSSTASDMFAMNSSFNLDKFYAAREPMYHSQHISDNPSNPFLPGMPGQHSVFSRDYTHRSFYTQNSSYPFMNMNDKNYSAAASSKLGHTSSAVGQQRELVPVPRPNMAHEAQLQDPYRHSTMLYNMMNRYFE